MTPSRADVAARWTDRSATATLRQAIRARLGIDLRALAAFRIALGLVVLADLLVLRLRELRVFYTDDGTLPRAALAELYPALEAVSLHALSGALWVQLLLVAIAAVLTGCLLVGYRTRTATVGAALLLASLQARNPYVLNGGDTIMLSLLVLGIFLPLGARWSIDARRRSRPADTHSSDRVCSVATATLLVHFVAIYAVNGVLKFRSDAWTSATGVRHIFQLEQYVVLLGPYVAELSTLLTVANWGWIGLLAASPLLIVLTGRSRLALAAAFIGAQLGLGATMRLGAFPFAMVAALLLFLPPRVWVRLERRVAEPVREQYLGRGSETGTGPGPGIESGTDSRATETGATTDAAVTSHANTDAATIASASHRLPAPIRRGARGVAAVVLVCFLLSILTWQAAGLGFIELPDEVVEDDVEDASWTFFAPNPPEGYWWYAWQAEYPSGETVGTLTDGSGAIDRPPDAADRYASVLWKRYGTDLRYADAAQYEPRADYRCQQLDREPETVSIYYLEQPVTADGPAGELEVDERIRDEC